MILLPPVINVQATKPDNFAIDFQMIALLNTPTEVNYYRNGGLLHTSVEEYGQLGIRID